MRPCLIDITRPDNLKCNLKTSGLRPVIGGKCSNLKKLMPFDTLFVLQVGLACLRQLHGKITASQGIAGLLVIFLALSWKGRGEDR